MSLYLQGLRYQYFQSIMGATEKRRESGAGVALVGDLESVRLGGREVYQDWTSEAAGLVTDAQGI
jgi:hypothetical protein